MKHTQVMDQEMSNTIQFSSPYPARKKRRPQKKRQFGWLQLIVALFICVIVVTTLGLGGYFSKEAGDGATKYEQLPTTTEGRSPEPGDEDDKTSVGDTPDSDDSASDEGTGSEEQESGDNESPVDTDSDEPAPGTTEGGKVHTVRKGETLYSITMDYYGNAKYMDLVLSANNMSDPSHVEAGTDLFIPPVQ